MILDGEIAALDEKGRSSFQLLQLFKKAGDVALVYYVFDTLFSDWKDLRDQPLIARRKLLAQVLEKAPEQLEMVDNAFSPHQWTETTAMLNEIEAEKRRRFLAGYTSA